MSEILTRTDTRSGAIQQDAVAVLERLLPLMPGVIPEVGGRVQLAVPGLGDRVSEPQWRSLLKSTQDASRRRTMAEYVRAMLRVNEKARAENKTLRDVAREHAETCQRTLES